MWSGVGILLSSFAGRWLFAYSRFEIAESIFIGSILGMLIAFLGFKRVARKNIKRILNLREKTCPFAFQERKSYLLILFMMSLGIYLRQYSLIPKLYLSMMYIGIGSALFISSFYYYFSFVRLEKCDR
ncbi:MAG: hypothetical protein AB7T22_04680 [Calditrichaceae bacterium]